MKIRIVCYSMYSSGLVSYTNRAYELSVEFCIVKFSSFGKDLMVYGIRSGKSLRLGMPKAHQGKIKVQPKA